MAPLVSTAKIFVNASAGWDSTQEAPERLRGIFEAAGIEADVETVEAGTDLAERAREAIGAGAGLVVAGGGDGTIRAVSSALAGTEVCLGVLPIGTLNHFARDLHLPLNLEGAAEVVIEGITEEVDVAEVNGKVFINNSIIGLYPIYRLLRADNERRFGSGTVAFLMSVMSVFRRYPVLKVRLHSDNSEITRRTPYILIANNRHAMEGYHLGRRDSLTEGLLWIYVMRETGRLGLLRSLAKLIAGRFRGDKDFEIFSAEQVWVELNRGKKAGIALDGEMTVIETPLHYRILPRSLKVRVRRPS